MASSKVDEERIDELIWGDLGSEIMETKSSPYAVPQMTEFAKDCVTNLFVGFINFIHYKCGQVPKLSSSEKLEFDKIDGGFDDHSSWMELMFVADKVHDKPYFFKQFTDKNGDKYTTCILMDTFSLVECCRILARTRLEDESRFSFTEISKEFHVNGKEFPRMLSYFEKLDNVEWTHTHTLVLRPAKLAEYLYQLDNELGSLISYPIRILRKEEWIEEIGEDALRQVSVLMDSSEEKVQELLKEISIEIPNVQVLTFYEYVRDKLTPEVAKEWEDIRNRYIAESKKVLKCMIPSLTKEDLCRSKASLTKARKAVEEERYAESVKQSYIAMEEFLDAMIKQNMPLAQKINIATKGHPDLRKYREGLQFIRTTRNALAHASGMDECDEDSAKFALDKMDQFLIGVELATQSMI